MDLQSSVFQNENSVINLTKLPPMPLSLNQAILVSYTAWINLKFETQILNTCIFDSVKQNIYSLYRIWVELMDTYQEQCTSTLFT
jgi:hypothetical protein